MGLWIGVLVVLWVLGVGGQEEDFCYEGAGCGPTSWGGTCASGRIQSPINIDTSRVKIRLQSSRLILSRNYASPAPFSLTNTGTTVQVRLATPGAYMAGDGIGRFALSQLHFHWGANGREGSEHRVGGRRYPLEMHIVHTGLKKAGRTAVLAVLFYLSPRDNPALAPILRNLGKVRTPSTVEVEGAKVSIPALLPRRIRMFRYVGSLTTPPCTEGVFWTVFQDPLPVSKKQLALFRKLKDANGNNIRKNFRPLQPTNSPPRNIYFLRMLRKRRGTLIG